MQNGVDWAADFLFVRVAGSTVARKSQSDNTRKSTPSSHLEREYILAAEGTLPTPLVDHMVLIGPHLTAGSLRTAIAMGGEPGALQDGRLPIPGRRARLTTPDRPSLLAIGAGEKPLQHRWTP